MKRHERLKLARIKAGFKTPNAASSAMGWPQRTYLRHELGETDFTKMAAVYAEAFGVKADYLLSSAESMADLLASLSNKQLTELARDARVLIMAPDGTSEILTVKGVWLISQS